MTRIALCSPCQTTQLLTCDSLACTLDRQLMCMYELHLPSTGYRHLGISNEHVQCIDGP